VKPAEKKLKNAATTADIVQKFAEFLLCVTKTSRIFLFAQMILIQQA
jgi:hypothetical protein